MPPKLHIGVGVSVQHKQDRKGVAPKAASLHQSLRSDGGVNMASAHTLKGQFNCTQGNSQGKYLLETGPAPYSFQTFRFSTVLKQGLGQMGALEKWRRGAKQLDDFLPTVILFCGIGVYFYSLPPVVLCTC